MTSIDGHVWVQALYFLRVWTGAAGGCGHHWRAWVNCHHHRHRPQCCQVHQTLWWSCHLRGRVCWQGCLHRLTLKLINSILQILQHLSWLFEGPLIKHSVFDAFFGVLSALLLLAGVKTRSPGLIITWLCFTLLASVKYVWVFVTHDWSSLEDWISITYLLFYSLVILIVISYLTQITSYRRNEAPAFSQPYSGT